MNSTHHTAGRFGNHLFRNMAVHFIAKPNDLVIHYTYEKEMKELGIELFSGGTSSYPESLTIKDDNFFSLLNVVFHKNIIVEPHTYCQTREFAHFLYNYFIQEDESHKNNVIRANLFKDRYNNNNDVFIHVRLGDIPQFSPGFQYYDKVLSSLEFSQGYISSDSIGDVICTDLIEKYQLKVIEMCEVQTIMFGSTCKHVVLSHGTFSWWIGLLGFYSTVWYPTLYNRWHGDIFVFPSWNEVK